MIELSFLELALLITGFFLGAAFIIMVYRMLGLGRDRQRGRRHRSRRDYYDDDDDYRGSYLPFIIVLLVVGAALSHKFNLVKIQDDQTLSKQNLEIGTSQPKPQPQPRDPDDIPFDEGGEVINEPAESDTEVENPSEDADVANNKTVFYIRVCVLSDKNNVEPTYRKLDDKGFSVFKKEKGDATAIYVGPFKSRDEADAVNSAHDLKGVIEQYERK